MDYVLGLDIGIASCGWCVIDLNEKRIENLGVRIFSKAEQPKTGESLAKPRRLARGKRRTLRRKAHRMERIKKLFVSEGLITNKDLETVYIRGDLKDPWRLRSEGLDRKLDELEWVRVLTQLAKRRGFKSNRKSEYNDKKSDSGKVLSNITENEAKLLEKGYRTVGEMFVKDEEYSFSDGYFIKNKRNKDGNYNNSVSRNLLIKELNLLFETQRKLGNRFTDEEFETKYMKIFADQRPFSNREMIDDLRGHCTFEKNEKRAFKNCYTSEYFVLLTKLVNLRITDGTARKLSIEEMQKIIKMAFDKKEIKYSDIRKKLNIPEEFIFTGISYKDNTKAENEKFAELKGYYEIKSTITKEVGVEAWNIIDNPDMLDNIVTEIGLCKSDEELIKNLKKLNIEDKVINSLLSLSFSKTMHLSISAMKKIIPYLEKGLRYDEACMEVGYNHSDFSENKGKSKYLPTINGEDIVNPVVIRALSQTRKVINAIIEKYGSPTQINIEVARDMSKTFEERIKIENKQKDNQVQNENLINELKENYPKYFMGSIPKYGDILKWKLYKQQNGYCPYSNEYIEPERLFEIGYVEVDHIIPYSRSMDDSIMNKVLVKGKENQNKKNRIPAEYFGIETQRWNDFVIRVKNSSLPMKKKERLLKEEFDENNENEWKQRNLNDTRYITSYISRFIKENLEFAPSELKVKVLMPNGAMTAKLRGIWGLNKVRENGDLHHALDAAVIATVNQGLINKITEYYKYEEKSFTEKAKKKFPVPWEKFKDEVEARLSDNPKREIEVRQLQNYLGVDLENIKPILVSRMPERKVKGEFHQETIRSKKHMETEGVSTIKVLLSSLDLKKLEKMYDKEHNKRLYEALKERLEKYNGNAKKAFSIENPFYKPTKNGERGPLVRSIKISEVQNTGIEVQGGIADNSSMIRVDIFTKDDKYYIVPIYTKDVGKNELPNKAIIAHKIEKDWDIIDETYEFCFSIYKNDFISIKTKKGEFMGYYISTHRGTGAITIDKHDSSEKDISIGCKTAISIKKYHIDILGNKYEVKGEKRCGLEKCNN